MEDHLDLKGVRALWKRNGMGLGPGSGGQISSPIGAGGYEAVERLMGKKHLLKNNPLLPLFFMGNLQILLRFIDTSKGFST